MVNKCVVPGCKTGYKLKEDQNFKMPPNVTTHAFPKEPELKKRWLRAIPRSTSN